MPAPPRVTIWSLLWFSLKWHLLLILVAVVSLVLALTDYPLLALLPLVLGGVLFWRDAARISRAIQGRIIRRVGGELERKSSLKTMIASAVVTLALGYLLVSHLHYAVLVVLAVGAVAALLRPFAIRYGWFEEGRIAARLHRPRFIDERFRGSVDPAGRS